MRRCIVLGMILTLAIAFAQASAFAQAAVESVLLDASSATATAKAGSTLGSALNRVDKQLAGRVQQQTSQPVPEKMLQVGPQPSRSPVKGTTVRPGTNPAPGVVVTSIKGTVTKCAPTDTPLSTPDQTPAHSAQTNCSGHDSVGKPVPQKYKSVMTVSF